MNEKADAEPQPQVLLTEEAPDARRQRRALLATDPNPARRRGEPIDYLIAYEAPLGTDGGLLRLTYVPGKLILAAHGLQAYIDALNATLPPEALAHVVLDDINDELVPRWVQIVIECPPTAPTARRQRVLVEDREPHWDDPALISRAPRL